jgi:hypothetical protein
LASSSSGRPNRPPLQPTGNTSISPKALSTLFTQVVKKQSQSAPAGAQSSMDNRVVWWIGCATVSELSALAP